MATCAAEVNDSEPVDALGKVENREKVFRERLKKAFPMRQTQGSPLSMHSVVPLRLRLFRDCDF